MRTAKAYTLGWLLLLALPAFAWYLVVQGPLRSAAFRLVTPEQTYLANLRESELACKTLALRRPEVLVLGDSHSYAAWDFGGLERGLGRRVGACALGGLYAESVPELMDYALRAAPQAKDIVLGLSPRMFWESPTRKNQIDFHRQLFGTMTPDAAPFVLQAIGRKRLPYDDEAAAVLRHGSRLESLDEVAVAARLELSPQSIRTLRDWSERLRDVKYVPELSRTAQEICGIVRAAGLRLWVLHIPESPYLEARYSAAVWEQYRNEVDALRPCAQRIVLDRAVSYALGNRHYVNRQLKDEHDYAGWSSTVPLSDDLAFDADHLNPVGARLFTPRVLDRMRKP